MLFGAIVAILFVFAFHRFYFFVTMNVFFVCVLLQKFCAASPPIVRSISNANHMKSNLRAFCVAALYVELNIS